MMDLNHLFRHLSIRSKLIIAFVALSTIPVCIIGFYEINSRLRTLEGLAIENVQEDVFGVQERAQAFLSHVEQDMHYLSHVLSFQELAAELDETDSHGSRALRRVAADHLLSFAYSKRFYYRFKLIDLYGDEVLRVEQRAGTPAIVPDDLLLSDRGGYYLRAMQEAQPEQVLLMPAELLDHSTGTYVPVISYAIPIFDADRILHAILIADIHAEAFFQILEASHTGLPGHIYVVSPEGYYLYHYAKKRDWSHLLAARDVENLYHDYPPTVADQILSGGAGTIAEKADAIISYAPLFYGPKSYQAFYVVYRDVPKEELFASVQRFRQVYVGLILCVVLAALMFGLLAARQFTLPILQLIEGATVIGNGEFGRRLDVRTNDEIEDLAHQFNLMATAIQQREAENLRLRGRLEQYAEQLEERAEERARELREAQHQLIQVEKLSAIGRLAAGVAHEINNPMAVISTCVEGLQSQLKDVPIPENLLDLPEYLTAIREAAYRCKGITQKLLSFSRQTPLVFTEMDINQVLTETIALVAYGATQAKKEIVLDLIPDLPQLMGDPDQLRQVFLNLTLNALDAMQAGDRLEICTRVLGEGAQIHFKDTGSGIPPEQLDKIFEPFYTTKGTGRGTGLGLAICQGIIESHRGRIELESTVGIGTEFKIYLPKGGEPPHADSRTDSG